MMTKKSRTTEWRHRRAAERAQRAEGGLLVQITPSTAWLPMPFTPKAGGPKLTADEWREYRARRARHLQQEPAYDAGWHRPTPATAAKVWALVAPVLGIEITAFLPNSQVWSELTHVEREEAIQTAKQALTVALDTALSAGERGTMLTTNHVFDALAACWSDQYRTVRATTRATCSWDMRRETIVSSWRDLTRNSVQLGALYTIVQKGCPGLYTSERSPGQGYVIRRVTSDLRAQYDAILADDPDYLRVTDRQRLLLADAPPPMRGVRCEVAAEWAHQVTTPGARSVELMRRLEASCLWLNVPAFLKDVDALETTAGLIRLGLESTGVNPDVSEAPLRRMKKAKNGEKAKKQAPLTARVLELGKLKKRAPHSVAGAKAMYKAYDATHGPLTPLLPIRDQLNALQAAGRVPDGQLLIKSGFSKTVNRRYQAENFWPSEVTGKDRQHELELEAKPGAPPVGGWRELPQRALWSVSSRRGRWFAAQATGLEAHYSDKYEWFDEWGGDRRPLVGVDVSSSQLQTLAIFLGFKNLEAAFQGDPERPRHTFKDTLAERAWARHLDPADAFKLPTSYTAPGMTPEGKLTPDEYQRLRDAVGTAVMTRIYGSEETNVAHKLREDGLELGNGGNVSLLFDEEPVKTLRAEFLPACRYVADVAMDRDQYAGVQLIDPYDGAAVRWNPVQRRKRKIERAGTKVEVLLPSGKVNSARDYPVWRDKLRRDVAPYLAHMLDATFAGFVVEALNARGVKDVVSIHDCWMIASDARPALYEAIDAAGEPWLRSLGVVYDGLAAYLGPHPIYGPWLREIRETWAQRVADANWPRFRVKPEELVELYSKE